MSFFVRDYPVLTKVPSRIPGLCSLDVSTLPSRYDNQNNVFNANVLPRESKASLEAFHLQFKAPNLEVFPSVCRDYIFFQPVATFIQKLQCVKPKTEELPLTPSVSGATGIHLPVLEDSQ